MNKSEIARDLDPSFVQSKISIVLFFLMNLYFMKTLKYSKIKRQT